MGCARCPRLRTTPSIYDCTSPGSWAARPRDLLATRSLPRGARLQFRAGAPTASGSTTTVRMDFRVLSTPSAVGSMPACSVWRTRSTVASVVDSVANGMTSSVRMPSDSPDRYEPKHAMMNGASSEVPCSRSKMSFATSSVYRRLERSRVLQVGMVYFTVAANGSMGSTTKPNTVP